VLAGKLQEKNVKKIIFFASLKLLKKGVGSGSISLSTDPHQNVTDPQHRPKLSQRDLTWGRGLQDGRRAAGVEGDQGGAALRKLDWLQRRLLSRGRRRGGRGPRGHTEAGVRLTILITRRFEQWN
jgi:hypothetical protein